MEKLALKTYLSDKYQGWDSFCETIVLPIFGKDNYEDKRKKEVLDMKPERRLLADATGIKSVKFCAQTYVSGEPLQFFDITVSDKVMMDRNRVNVQKIIRSVMDQYSSAFMIFHYEDESKWEWRFSFCYKSENEDESTDRKRYTFLLGPGQSCRTAAENFMALYDKQQKDEDIELDDLINAFNVEALSNEFFNGYKEIYEDIIEYVTGKRMVKVANKWEEKVIHEPNEEIMCGFARFLDPEKAVRDYVKKLMGRLVFLQFLQKKGWLGVKVNERWGEGSPTFIKDLFDETEDKDNFIDNMLEALFNDLNTERTNDLVSSVIGDGIRVPYLNGGLFERDAADEARFPLPAVFMERLLFFFSCYNFTIDENDPNDAEVGVDPEMLGRIFENLLEDNKDKGAFYTPKEIVTYMCRESLIAYLQTDIEDEETKEAIRQFVSTQEKYDKLPTDTDQRLKDVKICDPAIGSGAFPMGLLKELFLCRTALESIEQSKAADIKKHIIQQNIYGVDIEKGAVDIARLRFWLSLIVDEETPQALPNLDFKIMRGNSLLEQYKGFDLSTIMHSKKKVEGPVQMTFFEDNVDVLRRQVIGLRRAYFRETNKKKKKDLRQNMHEIVQQQINALSYDIDLSGIDIADNSEFFLWHTWFSDVFEDGGFDIVIGNPPYIQLQANEGFLADIYQGKGFETYNRSGDIFSLFYEQGWNLLKNKGYLCYITSNKWMRNESGLETRRFFATKSNPKLLMDFAGMQLFENATVETNILIFAKEENTNNTLAISVVDNDKSCLSNLDGLVINNGVQMQFDTSEDWIILSPVEYAIQKKINKIAVPLKESDVEINFGIKTGYNAAFIIDSKTRETIIEKCLDDEERKKTKSLIVPVLRGRDIKRYFYNWEDLWLINVHNGLRDGLAPVDVSLLPSLKEYLDIFWNHLSTRSDKGVTPYNLRNCAYLREFSKPKIIWGEISDRSKFCYDEKGEFFCEATTFFMTGEISTFLLCYLNSKMSEYLFSKIATRTGMGTTRWKKYKIEKLPVPHVSKMIEDKVDEFYRLYKQTLDVEWLNKIDTILYELYGLTEEEIKIVEGRE